MGCHGDITRVLRIGDGHGLQRISAGRIGKVRVVAVVVAVEIAAGDMVPCAGDGGFCRALTLIAAHAVDKLQIVVIKIAAAHHFKVTAVFVVGAVDEHNRAFGNAFPSAGNPFVPTCHEYKIRVT